MSRFARLVSIVFGVVGLMMIRHGEARGWLVYGVSFVCFMIASLEPHVAKRRPANQYRVLITEGGISCKPPWRRRESIRWEDVNRIWHVTTAALHAPDDWILLEGDHSGCSFPAEATGAHALRDELQRRFPGFTYGQPEWSGACDTGHLCWEKPAA